MQQIFGLYLLCRYCLLSDESGDKRHLWLCVWQWFREIILGCKRIYTYTCCHNVRTRFTSIVLHSSMRESETKLINQTFGCWRSKQRRGYAPTLSFFPSSLWVWMLAGFVFNAYDNNSPPRGGCPSKELCHNYTLRLFDIVWFTMRTGGACESKCERKS